MNSLLSSTCLNYLGIDGLKIKSNVRVESGKDNFQNSKRFSVTCGGTDAGYVSDRFYQNMDGTLTEFLVNLVVSRNRY